MTDPKRRLLAVLAVGILPWSLVTTAGATTIFHSVAFVNLAGPQNAINVYEYVFVFTDGLPEYILSWPIGLAIYAAALVSATLGLSDREDPRLTAGLLVLVALTQLNFTIGFASRPGYFAVPIATFTVLALVWWAYWPLVDLGRIWQ